MKLRAEVLSSERLSLEPLRVADAHELAPLLGDSRLHSHIGGPAPTEAELRERFERQVAGVAPDGAASWLNWVLRARGGGAVGTLQATIAGSVAELAWVVGAEHQGRGFAREAGLAAVAWLRSRGVGSFAAHIGPANGASEAVALALGMAPTDVVRSDGERLWELRVGGDSPG